MVGRCSPARTRARAACISSRRSPASRMTSPRLSGDGSTGVVCAAAGTRRGRGPDHEEESEPKTLETVHDVTALRMRVPPGRQRTPARTCGTPLPGEAGKVLVHLGSRGRFLGCIPRQLGETVVGHSHVCDSRTVSVRSGELGMLLRVARIALGERRRNTPRDLGGPPACWLFRRAPSALSLWVRGHRRRSGTARHLSAALPEYRRPSWRDTPRVHARSFLIAC